MSFSDLEDAVPETSYPNVASHKRVVMALHRMEDSWNVLGMTTASVMATCVAGLEKKDFEVGRQAMLGTAGILATLSDKWCAKCGSLNAEMPGDHAAYEESDKVDKLGFALLEIMDEFDLTLVHQLLYDVPKSWTKYFYVMVEVRSQITKELEAEDASYLCRLVADEQVEQTKAFVARMDQLLQPGSVQVKKAAEWHERAKKLYTELVQKGTPKEALRQVILQIGFINVLR
jgi:hypothetical protein